MNQDSKKNRLATHFSLDIYKRNINAYKCPKLTKVKSGKLIWSQISKKKQGG